jgi:hypothetical protein
MQAAALGSMGSQLPFAACSSSGYYADKAAIARFSLNVRN